MSHPFHPDNHPLHLPLSLQQRLELLFPNPLERQRFILHAIEGALQEEQDTEPPEAVGGTLHLFTDGGSRGNPGQAAVACILEDPTQGKILKEHFECIGIATNNVAEYKALMEGLRIARRFHPNTLTCFLDSELLVKQLNGEYRVKMVTLQPLFEMIRTLTRSFPHISFQHIPREDNHRADALVNKALSQHPFPPFTPPGKGETH